jgi:hypothetical protein
VSAAICSNVSLLSRPVAAHCLPLLTACLVVSRESRVSLVTEARMPPDRLKYEKRPFALANQRRVQFLTPNGWLSAEDTPHEFMATAECEQERGMLVGLSFSPSHSSSLKPPRL